MNLSFLIATMHLFLILCFIQVLESLVLVKVFFPADSCSN